MLEKIQQWYLEAAALHGDDWHKIENYVARKIASIGQADHAQLLKQFKILLRDKSEILN